MQVTEVNDIKTYNLSHGKTIPEWLSDRKKRMLIKKDVDLRRRIQLIQDFDMPTLSNTVDISPDGQYIIATGIYKPRVRCYDVNNLAMKFERCLDAEVIKCIVLSDDYSKLLFLEDERYVELHSQFGFYYKTRIPKFGRDMAYNKCTCDAYFVGNSHEIYRLNLEVGTFLKPFETKAVALNAVSINPAHNLMVVGSKEGFVEAWDPRVRECVATLDCAFDIARTDSSQLSRIPAVTTIAFRDALTMGVGTSTGQILLYDIRANRPFLNKDHMYGLPIKTISYLDGPLELVASLDSKIIKLWNRNDGTPFTAIQADCDLNMLASYPDSGMLFVSNESQKILSYYIPAIGPAPKWCSFLDRITEELEESNTNSIYDDYKFLTEQELEEVGLTDLIGTNLLRAYMHGYFIDMRLYRKARDASQPFAYDEYRKKKIREKIDSDRADRVKIPDKLTKVNRSLAERLLYDEEESQKDKKANSNKKYKANPLKDDRFSAMFKNPDFQIDELSEEFRLLNPVLSRLAKPKKGEAKPVYADIFEEDKFSSDDDDDINSEDDDEDSSDHVNEDDNLNDADSDIEDQPQISAGKFSNTMKNGTKNNIHKPEPSTTNKTKVYRLKDGKDYGDIYNTKNQKAEKQTQIQIEKQSFEQRLKGEQKKQDKESIKLLHGGIGGNRVMSFVPKSTNETRDKELRTKEEQKQKELTEHVRERKQLARRARGLRFNKKKFS